jgi:hypothetical protein
VAETPREGVKQVAAETNAALQALAKLPAPDSATEEARQQRKVVVTAVDCRTQ